MDKNDNVEVETTETPQEEEVTNEAIKAEEETESGESESEDKDAIIGRLKRENTKLKKQTVEPKETEKQTPTEPLQTNPMTREEIRLVAKYDDDTVDELTYIAEKQGVSLAEAEKSDRFKVFKRMQEEKAQEEKAQMSVARGGKKTKEEITFDTPGLTYEQRHELWKKSQK